MIAVLIVVIQGINLADAVSTSGNTTTSAGGNVTSGTVPPSSGFSSGNSRYGNPGRCGSSAIPSSSCGAFGSGGH